MSDGVTVVVPTFNRGEVVASTVNDLLEESHRPLEILVVDQSGDPDTGLMDFEQAHPKIVNYQHVSFRGLPVARNFGWMNARHDAVAFADDDVRITAGFVSSHIDALNRDLVGLVGGQIIEARGETSGRSGAGYTGKFDRVTGVASRGFEANGCFEIDHVGGGNFSAWRDVLRRAGGFDERLGSGAALMEETELCLRVKNAGYRVIFEGAASLTHLRVGEGGCRVPDASQYVRSLARNRSVVVRRHVAPPFWAVALSRSLLYGLAYAVAYRQPLALTSCLRGVVEGWRVGGLTPLCTGGKRNDG